MRFPPERAGPLNRTRRSDFHVRDLLESVGRLFAAASAENASFGIFDEGDPWTIAAFETMKTELERQGLADSGDIGRPLSREETVTLVLEVLDQIEAQKSNPTGKRN